MQGQCLHLFLKTSRGKGKMPAFSNEHGRGYYLSNDSDNMSEPVGVILLADEQLKDTFRNGRNGQAIACRA